MREVNEFQYELEGTRNDEDVRNQEVNCTNSSCPCPRGYKKKVS